MSCFFRALAWLVGLGIMAYHKTSRHIVALSLLMGFIITLIFTHAGWIFLFTLAAVIAGILLPLYFPEHRRYYFTGPLLKKFQKSLPKISETERIAIEAGTIWWDGQLFSGDPQWTDLFKIPVATLTDEEQAFLDGPLETLCEMINDWDICYVRHGLSPELWQFLKEQRFFALIIPKEYGGLAFSALAHSEILSKVASCSLTVASVVAVPNSLGPVELLLKYGTSQQQSYYLPRLAKGIDIPCFSLTGPEAGSDATAIPDHGIICRGLFNDEEILGIRLNWDKRYTTLAPIATLLGLAFKLYDPDHLLGETTDIGITCALIPTNTAGITIGHYHRPLNAPFPNGPTQGKDVFIPLDWIIGGAEMAGQGWRMLVECLSAGRAISLPSSCTGAIKALAAATGAYARIRRQFRQPIGRFEGIEEVLARIAGNAYLAEAARVVTAASIDRNEAPSVLGAIIKYHLTERGRQTAMDAMDIQGGKAIMLGPKNTVALPYQNIPICITVEGANILTRSMIIFGQGALRAHPYLLRELQAANEADPTKALEQFDHLLSEHILHTIRNAVRAFWMGLIQFRWSHSYTDRINRASSAFAFIADICFIIYAGKLKFKEKISGRLADCLSMMYLASCTLKHYQDQGQKTEDRDLVDWVLRDTLSTFWIRIEDIIQNLPNAAIRILLRLIILPLGKRVYKPSDSASHRVAAILLTPSITRDRLIQGAYLTPTDTNVIGQLEVAFAKIIAAEQENASADQKAEAEKLRKEVIAVDQFP